MAKKKFLKSEANKIIDREQLICSHMKYFSGGYYKNQKENHDIYLAVKKEMKDLPKLDFAYYEYFEKNNCHSLNQVLVDLKRF